MRLGHGAVQENQLGALLVAPLLVQAHGLVHHHIQLSARFVHQVAVPCLGVQRQLAGAVHQSQSLFVSVLHIFNERQAVVAVDHLLNQALLCGRRVCLDGAPATALNLRHREFTAWVVFCKPRLYVVIGHHVRHGVVAIHEGAHIGPVAAQSVDHFEPVPGLGRLVLLGCLHVLGAEGVEVLQPRLLQHGWRKVAHDGVHLHRTVADGCTSQECGRPVGFVQDPHLGVQVEGLLRASGRPQPAHIGQARGICEVFEFVTFVHGQVVNSHLLKGQQLVFTGLAAHHIHAVFQFQDQGFCGFDG